MFCVLYIQKRENTLRERIFGRFIKDEYNLRTVNVFKGAPFYVLTARVGVKGADWDEIIGTAGKCAYRLLDNGIAVPDDKGISFFKSSMLYKIMMKNTLIRIIEKNYSLNNSPNICIIDRGGKNSDAAVRLAYSAKKMTVVTDDKDSYDDACSKILRETGLSVSLCSNYDNADIILDTDYGNMKVKTAWGVCFVSGGEDFTAEKVYYELMPQGVLKYDFFSALYELCGIFSIKDYFFDTVHVNGKKKNTDTLYFT